MPIVGQDEGVVVGRPEIELTATDNRLTWGEQDLNVTLSNSGVITQGGPEPYEERVQTARNVRLEIATDRLSDRLGEAIQVESGPVLAGTVPPGTAGPYAFRLELDQSLSPGTYEIPIRITYDYTRFVEYRGADPPRYADSTRTTVTTVTVIVESRSRFEVSAESGQSITAGDIGSYRITITNTGTQTATDAVITLQSSNASLFFGGPNVSRSVRTIFVPQLRPGESYTTAIRIGALRTTTPGVYPILASVAYETPNGVPERSRDLVVGVAVGGEQTFTVRNVVSNVSAGGTGTIRGVVTNTGARPVRDAVLTVRSKSPLDVRNPEYALGNLAPRASMPFEFVIDANGTEPGPVPLSFRVDYRNEQGDRRTSPVSSAQITIDPEQAFTIRNVSSTLQVGTDGVVRGTLVNTGSGTVRNASLIFDAGDQTLRVRNSQVGIGTLNPGEMTRFAFRIDVSNRTESGLRQLSVRVQYRDQQGERQTSESIEMPVSIAPRPSLELRNVSTNLSVGASGTIRGTVVNTGSSTLSNTVVVYQTAGGAGTLQPRETEYALGTLEPDEAARFAFRVDVSNRTTAGPREISFRVRYRTPGSDETAVSDVLTGRVLVGPEPSFAVRNVTANLSVGASGTVEGVLVNTGETTVSNGVVVFQPGTGTLTPRETTYAVESLAPGESVPFSFRVDVSNRSTPGPRQVGFRVQYTVGDETRVSSDPLDSRIFVTPERDVFRVEPVAASVEIDQDSVLAVNVTNVGTTPLHEIRATMVTTDPLSSEDSGAFVPVLVPSETATLRFAISASEDAVSGTDSISLTFTYTDPTGDRITSEPYLVPVKVTREEPEVISFVSIGAIAAVLLLALVWWWWRR